MHVVQILVQCITIFVINYKKHTKVMSRFLLLNDDPYVYPGLSLPKFMLVNRVTLSHFLLFNFCFPYVTATPVFWCVLRKSVEIIESEMKIREREKKKGLNVRSALHEKPGQDKLQGPSRHQRSPKNKKVVQWKTE